MRTLLKEFNGRRDTAGWTFRQVKRSTKFAIFERTRGEDVSYEVIRIRKFRKDTWAFGRLLGRVGDEYYPYSSEWGKYGWSFLSRDAAEKKYRGLVSNQH
jgi:hypothetical protein